MKRKIAHIINPVFFKESNELSIVQPITFESMKRAKEYALNQVDVTLLTAQYIEDRTIIPNYFSVTEDLTKSVLDEREFTTKRKLPLLKDILDKLYSHSNADYFVYTNVDIGLMPQFYIVINEFIDSGLDAFIINRRRVSKKYNSINQLDQIFTETGIMHNGYDCFVFKREIYPKFELGNVCIGIPQVGNTLAHNLFGWSTNFKLFTDKHLTFHIGMELVKKWGDKEYLKHNYTSYRKVLKKIYPHFKIENIPGSGQPFLKRHFKWLMNPTLHYPTLLKLDIQQWNTKRPYTKKINSGNKFHEWLQKKIKLN